MEQEPLTVQYTNLLHQYLSVLKMPSWQRSSRVAWYFLSASGVRRCCGPLVPPENAILVEIVAVILSARGMCGSGGLQIKRQHRYPRKKCVV
jgi:hypothetical protein